MDKRFLKKDRFNWLISELTFLEENGFLNTDLRTRIADLYAIRPEHRMNKKRLFQITLCSLGVLMFGFAIFLLICYNWNGMSPTLKTCITSGSLLMSCLVGLGFQQNRKGLLAELSFFFSGILFGVNIWQLAQIYNFSLDFSFGFWLWGLGLLLLATSSRLPLLHYIAAAVLVIWIPSELSSYQTGDFSPFYELFPSLPVYAYSLPFLAAFGCYYGVRKGWNSLYFIYFFVFTWWVAWQPLSWNGCEESIIFYYIFVGLLYLLTARWFIKRRRVKQMLTVLGALPIYILIPVLTFRECILELASSNRNPEPIPFIVLGSVLVLLLLLKFRFVKTSKEAGTREHPLSFFFFSPYALAFWTIPAFIGIIASFSILCTKVLVIILPVFFSILMFGAAWWCIIQGVRKSVWLFWFGIIYFITWSIIRYIDLFARAFGMLEAAGIFAFVGLVLLIAGWIWTRRGQFIEQNEKSPQTNPNEISAAMSLESNKKVAPQKLPEVPDLNRPFNKSELLKLKYVILFMFVILGGIIYFQIEPFQNATQITVETTPIDPRSLFRGDYVILNYSFNSTSGTVWRNGKEVKLFESELQRRWWDTTTKNLPRSRTVYTVLKPGPDPQIWIPVKMTSNRPSVENDQLVIRGRSYQHRSRVKYGIEQIFLQAGTGRKYELAMSAGQQRNKVHVDLLIAPNGRARVKNIRIVEARVEEREKPAIQKGKR